MMSQNPDVIVIGGGVIGLAIADALARQGVSVTLLERGNCGREASWAGAGIVQSGSWHRRDPLVQMQRESVRLYESFAADLRERTGIDPEYIRCGSLEVLLEDQHYRMARSEVKVAAAFEQDYGRKVLELLTPQQTQASEPALTHDLLGAKCCPMTGQVRNPRLLQGLCAACRRGGVEIVENCGVERLRIQNDRVTGVQTPQGLRSAAQVILAAGCWSSLLDERLAKVMPVLPVRGQIALLKMPTVVLQHVIERGRTYLVPRRDGHVVVGATQEPEAGFDKSVTAGGIGGLLGLATRLVPGLAPAVLVQTWAGLRPGTPDGRPYIGAVPGLTGLMAATGHFRSGLTLTPLTARIVADLILRGQTAHDISRCLPGRELENRLAASAGV
ncbi:MAG: glycine oxidase ThiO [Planctomycetes bacterium]|nr:glycine oxidase ThiO [Planctomycetota bacterium]